MLLCSRWAFRSFRRLGFSILALGLMAVNPLSALRLRILSDTKESVLAVHR